MATTSRKTTSASGSKARATTPRKSRQARERVRVTVYLDEPLANWGKQQEGGLSELLRRLLMDAQQEQNSSHQHYPIEIMTPYKRLIDKKLAQGLTVDEEQELVQVRECINAFDRASPAWQRAQETATAIDQQLTDLRTFIQSHPKKSGDHPKKSEAVSV
ncbi:hypothetical protein [Armatimonas sp.]|uniref:hypothetical protein n=1 Tax=Armatimonas sp. TaxID=1872638 RepID=UPI00375114EC